MQTFNGRVLIPDSLCLSAIVVRLEMETDKTIELPVGFHRPHSYRGDYSEVAFEITEDITIQRMLDEVKSAIGTVYEGYKGGNYLMRDYTTAWLVLEEGVCGETIGSVLLDLLLANRKREA